MGSVYVYHNGVWVEAQWDSCCVGVWLGNQWFNMASFDAYCYDYQE
jgi:hypothetical protein